MRTFRLPDLGEGLQEAQIVEWHIEPGTEVKADQPLVSVETDKAVTEVPAPWTGRVARLCADIGEVVKVGAPVVEYEGESGPAEMRAPAPAAPRAAEAPRPAKPAPSRGVAMPAVRLLAKELGLDIAGIRGTGPDGAVLVRDVAQAFRASVGAQPVSQASASSSEGFEPLTGPRRAMAQNMARSHAAVVPATVHEEAVIGSWKGKADITLRLVRAILAGIAAEPVANAAFDAVHGLRPQPEVDLGLAVDAPDGLIVPVVRNAGGRSDLRAEIDRLVKGASDRSLPAADLRGATITLSNYGMIGGLHATPVVMPPQVAIVGAGRRREQAVAEGGKVVVRPVLPISFTYDHRALTGGEAARFVTALVADLERPE